MSTAIPECYATQMGALTRKHLLWFFFYFSVAASIGLFIRDVHRQPSLFATINNFMLSGSVPAADPNSFATGALDIYRYGWFKEDNQWLIRLWPPGFMVLEGLVLKCFGVEAPFILILIVLNSIFLGFLLLVFRAHLLRVVPVKAASMLPLLPLFLPVTRFFLLQPGGIILGEAFSIVFFLTAMFLIPLAIRNRSWGEAIPAGLLLALSAYFRSNFELLVTFLTLMAALLVLSYYLLFRNWIRRVDRDIMSCFIRTVVIVLSVANAAMVPWRIHNYYHSGNFSWTQTPNIEYRNAGLTDEQLTDNNGFFVVRGGGNLACKLRAQLLWKIR